MTFDPTQFLDQTTTEATDTRALIIPENLYPAIVDKVNLRLGDIKKGDRAGEQFVALDVSWNLDDEGLRQQFDRSKIVVVQGIMLDVKSIEPFVVDFGPFKNRALGLVREALGLNTAGQPFAFNMMVARPAKVQIKHRPDGDIIRNDVAAVFKFA